MLCILAAMPKEPTVLTWAWRLKDLMRERGRTGRAVERELGWGTGYMSQILRDGPPALKVEHVLAILRVIGVPPADFFAGLYGLEAPVPADRDEIRRVLEEVVAEGRAGDDDDRLRATVRRLLREERQELVIDRDEIRAVVGDIVREELMRLAAGPGAPRQPSAGDAGASVPGASRRNGEDD